MRAQPPVASFAMKTQLRSSLLAAAVLPLALSAAAAPAAQAKYKECEFTKKLAKKEHAPRCKPLGRSRWIVVSGEWEEVLTIKDATDGATFSGQGSANFQALGLNGNSPFPNFKHRVRSLVSARPEGVELEGATHGGWTTKSRFYECGITIPEWAKPNGFGGIFMLSGKNVRVQWILGASGFGCGTSPYPTPSPDFPDPVAKYPLKRFRGNRRLVRLPIAFDFKDVRGSFSARVTYDGIARLRRYR